MKKLLLLLILSPIIGLSQACNYGGISDASELCNFVRSNSFSSDRNADIALDKILSVTGMSKRFVLQECRDINNCVATAYKGVRYILYDKYFMDIIAHETNSWSNLSILAHEIGHHVNGHSLDIIVYESETVEPPTLSESRQMELEADEFSGFVMYKLGASLYQAQEAVRLICTNDNDTYSTHPKLDKRLSAIEKGYNNAKSQGSNNDYSNNSSNLTAEDYFYKAYNNKSDYQYKIDNYTKCLRVDPDYYPATVYNNRGLSYYKLGNYEDAIADFTRSIRIDSDYTSAYFNRGISYMELGNYEEARLDYTRAIKVDPEYKKAYNGRGDAYYKLGNYEDALADFTRAIRIDPDYTAAYRNRGVSYNKLGNYEDAISDHTRAIRIDPDYAAAYKSRGIAKENAGLPYCDDYKKACDLGLDNVCEWYYKQCKNPDDDLTAEEYFYKAYDYAEEGKYQLAIDNYMKCLRIDPDYYPATVYNNRGAAYDALGDYEAAIADYNRALRIDPDYDLAYKNRGIAKVNTGISPCSDYKKACDLGKEDCCEWYYDECQNSHNNSTAEEYFNKAFNYAKKGEHQLSIDNYTKCLRVDPDYYPATLYYNRGVSYHALENYQKAIADYNRAIRIEPDYTDAYYNRGNIYKIQENYEYAISDYTRVIRIDPDYASAYINRGNAYDDLGNTENAIEDYNRAIRIDPDDAIAYKNRGIAKEKIGIPYCSDYKRACDLGKEECCEWYYKQCR